MLQETCVASQELSRLTCLTALHAHHAVTSSSTQDLISALPQLRDLDTYQLKFTDDDAGHLRPMPPLSHSTTLTSLSYELTSTEVLAVKTLSKAYVVKFAMLVDRQCLSDHAHVSMQVYVYFAVTLECSPSCMLLYVFAGFTPVGRSAQQTTAAET
jgi:hypothetical protein